MVNNKTVFIVGAGASKEANLPTGDELKKRISELLRFEIDDFDGRVSGDLNILGALTVILEDNSGSAGQLNEYIEAAERIRRAMPQAISIDNFIDSHQGDEKIEICGKLAIVRSILQAEQQSNLSAIGSQLRWDAISKTWYNSFFQLLTENCLVDRLAERLRTVVVISFNYDRCVEHFLFHALQNYYGIDSNASASLVQELEIYHPYGAVGTLRWQEGNAASTIDFGGEPIAHQLVDLASQIRTFTEGTDPKSSEIDAIRKHVEVANTLVFLGFAYHKLNMKLLRRAGVNLKKPSVGNCIGTAHGLSKSDCGAIVNEIRGIMGANGASVNIGTHLTCKLLFKEYGRSLSLS